MYTRKNARLLRACLRVRSNFSRRGLGTTKTIILNILPPSQTMPRVHKLYFLCVYAFIIIFCTLGCKCNITDAHAGILAEVFWIVWFNLRHFFLNNSMPFHSKSYSMSYFRIRWSQSGRGKSASSRGSQPLCLFGITELKHTITPSECAASLRFIFSSAHCWLNRW